MPYRAVPVPGFGKGLNLRDRQDVVDPSEAIDLLNVTFTERGSVSSRYGYGRLTDTETTNQPDSVFGFSPSAGAKRLLVGNEDRIDAYGSFPGSSIQSTGSLTTTAFPHHFVRIGGPTREAVYISNGTDPVKRYDTTTGFSAPASLDLIAPHFVSSFDTRLVGAGFVGVTAESNPSTVRFSAKGDPETFGDTDFVQLDPGDGEAITGITTWRELLFVFKETKFFVFFGVSTDSVGGPVFNFRKVETGVGCAAPNGVASTREGVFFLSRDGIYKTTGQEPQQVSDVIDPFFVGGTAPTFRSQPLNRSAIAGASMTYHQERLYIAVPTGTSQANDRVLVHDPRYGWWSLHAMPAAAMCTFRPTTTDELIFAASTAPLPSPVGRHVMRHSPAFANDNMTPDSLGGERIPARWQSGWSDFGTPDVKTIRETRLWGEGTVRFRQTFDFYSTGVDHELVFGTASSDTWGGDQVIIVPPSDGDTDVWSDGTDLSDVWGDGTTEDIWNDGTVDPGEPGSVTDIPDDDDRDTWGDGRSRTDLWGPTRQIEPKLVRFARRGTVFSVLLSFNTLNSSWIVHRMDHHLRDERFPNTLRSEVAV